MMYWTLEILQSLSVHKQYPRYLMWSGMVFWAVLGPRKMSRKSSPSTHNMWTVVLDATVRARRLLYSRASSCDSTAWHHRNSHDTTNKGKEQSSVTRKRASKGQTSGREISLSVWMSVWLSVYGVHTPEVHLCVVHTPKQAPWCRMVSTRAVESRFIFLTRAGQERTWRVSRMFFTNSHKNIFILKTCCLLFLFV